MTLAVLCWFCPISPNPISPKPNSPNPDPNPIPNPKHTVTLKLTVNIRRNGKTPLCRQSRLVWTLHGRLHFYFSCVSVSVFKRCRCGNNCHMALTQLKIESQNWNAACSTSASSTVIVLKCIPQRNICGPQCGTAADSWVLWWCANV